MLAQIKQFNGRLSIQLKSRQSLLTQKPPTSRPASSQWSVNLVAAHLLEAVVPEHDPVMLWDLLHSLHRQLDNVV
jgi:hypothetical protein